MSDNNPRSSGWLGPWCLLVGVILLVTGLFLLSVVLNWFPRGSWYFLIAGVITLLSAIQFFRRKSSAVGLFATGVSWHPDLGIFRCRARLLAAGFPFNGTRRADGAGSCHGLHCVNVKENRPAQKGLWGLRGPYYRHGRHLCSDVSTPSDRAV